MFNDDELRGIELDENTMREGLTDFEADKARLAQIRQAEADLKAKAAAAAELRSKVERKSPTAKKRGRPARADSQRAVERETGISQTEQIRIERHVELGERYPFMQRPGWIRTNTLDAGDRLEALPAGERSAICRAA